MRSLKAAVALDTNAFNNTSLTFPYKSYTARLASLVGDIDPLGIYHFQNSGLCLGSRAIAEDVHRQRLSSRSFRDIPDRVLILIHACPFGRTIQSRNYASSDQYFPATDHTGTLTVWYLVCSLISMVLSLCLGYACRCFEHFCNSSHFTACFILIYSKLKILGQSFLN